MEIELVNKCLIPKKQNSFLEKIKNFFKLKIIKKNNKDDIQKDENMQKNSDEKNQFSESIEVDIKNTIDREYQLNQFLMEIENNTDLLFKLSNERLEILIDYYTKVTKKNQIKIDKLKKATY